MKRLAGDPTPHTTPSKIKTWEVDGTSPEKRRGPQIPIQASPTKLIKMRSSAEIERIRTYVFFDLECTDLIKNEDIRIAPMKKNCDRNDDYYNNLNNLCLSTRIDDIPYITEMSFMAIDRETFDEFKEQRQKLANWNEDHPESQQVLGRYIATNTHTRILNPKMSDNEWNSYERRRGLDRKHVFVHPKKRCERSNTFGEEWPGVVQFLDSLPKPVVLIGHNALKYDLRVIYGEMSRHKVLDQYPIPQKVFFADSLLMAREIESKMAKELVTVCKYVKFPKIPMVNDGAEVIVGENPIVPISPVREPAIVNGVLASDHPANFIDWQKFSVALKKRAKKGGFMRTATGWTYKQPESNRFGLGVLYEELVGGQFEAHFAQQDSEALMHVCLSFGDDFSQFVDEFAANIPF